MNTCGGCYYFYPTGGAKGDTDRVGNCLSEPPIPFIGTAPPTVLQLPNAPIQPAVMGIERVTRAGRPECRHWREA